jgi:hypothetical protein
MALNTISQLSGAVYPNNLDLVGRLTRRTRTGQVFINGARYRSSGARMTRRAHFFTRAGRQHRHGVCASNMGPAGH